MKAPQALAIHWYRRDLRILDNSALHHAAKDFPQVLPVYVASAWKHHHLWTGAKRQSYLCDSLKSLDNNLRQVGGSLIIRSGDPVEALGILARESKASAIFFNRDPDPHGRAVETRLEQACKEWGVECHGFHDVSLHHPDEVLTKTGEPYRVFTPYSRNWLSLGKPKPFAKPRSLGTPKQIKSEPLPSLSHWQLPAPNADLLAAGERAAHQRLKQALTERVPSYAKARDFPGIAGTSRLSQDLRFGLLSPRTIHARAMKARAAASSPIAEEGHHIFLKELAWREFYFAILHHFPQVLEHEFNANWRGLPWEQADSRFDAWKEGRTGFPIIDAGIRELLATGFMHNRVRMIVAMFLSKDLHLDWRLGEQFFMQHLIDGEIASNNGGWQWSAGTGADAAPYFRIQNPWTQSARFDSQGHYIKRWIPELAGVAAKKLHSPPDGMLPLAPGYPLPCLDHAEERLKTLAIFKRHREQLGR